MVILTLQKTVHLGHTGKIFQRKTQTANIYKFYV